MLEGELPKAENLANVSGVVTPNETLEKDSELAITSSLSTIGINNLIVISVLNITDHPITLSNKTEIGPFSVLTTDQAENLFQIDPQLISLAKSRNQSDPLYEINQLIQDFTVQAGNQPKRPPPKC